MGKLIIICGFLFLFFAAPPASHGSATDVWVTQAGAGGKDGTSLQNAASVDFIQSRSNCGNGPNQIGPGTTIHLSGNFTYPAGTNAAIVPACSGASGNPVVITTDPNTRPVVISSPSFSYGNSSSPCCAMSLHGLSYVTVDGGVPCGTTNGAIDSTNSCGLVIEDTASGTAYDAVNIGGMNDESTLFDAGGVTGIEVKNLALLNSYVHLPPWQISSVTFSGGTGTVSCSAACPVGSGKHIMVIGNSGVGSTTVLTTTANNGGESTFTVSGGPSSGSAAGGWAIDVWGYANGQSNFFASSIGGTSPGLLFHDSIAAHGGWLIRFNSAAAGAPPQVYNNQIFDFDHGFASGVCPAGGCGDGLAFPGPIIYNNHFHDSFNWDDLFDVSNRNTNTPGKAQGPNNNHHDPIHLQIDLATSNQRYFVSPLIYNNRVDGDAGVDTNNYFFLRASTTNESVFNNIFQCVPARPIGAPIGVGDNQFVQSFTRNPLIVDNLLGCTGDYAFGSAFGGVGNNTTYGTSGETFYNNIVQGLRFDFNASTTGGQWATAAGGLDYNVYEDANADSKGVATNFVANSFGFSGNTITSWQSFLRSGCGGCAPLSESNGQDMHSVVATNAVINVTSVGQPRSGSPALGNGTNLSSLCIGTLAALCKDVAGNQRPATGPWDIGAYYLSGGTLPNPPAAPSGLTAVVD